MNLGQGAEAVVTKIDSKTVLKDRIPKTYRHPAIDAFLRKTRTRKEATIFKKLAEINFPAPRLQLMDDKKMQLTMDFVDGLKVRDVLAKKPELAKEIGRKVGILHANNIIHGDLTTSNMILANEIYFIDFGLSFVSTKAEDKAVDLRLLKQALDSAHHKIAEKAYADVVAGYKEGNPGWHEILVRLEIVEKRGRNKK